MLKSIYDLFFPHARNNHRAKILHNINILLILVLFIAASFFTSVVSNARPDILGISYSISETELLALVNNEREKEGLPPLLPSSKLSDAARRKAADMLEKNYWAHFPPDGSTSPWEFIRASGYNYIFAGENLAKGFTNSSSAVNAWMNSPTHRDNILSSNFKEVGFAIVPGTLEGEETVLIVEMFGSSNDFIARVTEVEPNSEAIPEEETKDITQEMAEVEVFIQGEEAEPLIASEANFVSNTPTIDTNTVSKAFSAVGFSFLAFAFAVDLMIVERKKIPRIVGHNLDHLMLIVMFLFFILFIKGGSVL